MIVLESANYNTLIVSYIHFLRWATAWKTWLSIGQQATRPNLNEESAPTQAFLTSLAHIFPLLFPHVSETFTNKDLAALNEVLQATLALPVAADSELGFFLTASEDSLLPLHAAIAKCASVVESRALGGGANELLPGIFHLFLNLAKLTHTWPEGAGRCGVKGIFPEKFILLGERSLLAAGRLYERTHAMELIREERVIADVVEAVKNPLQLKYSCIKQSSWRVAIQVLLSVLEVSMEEAADRQRFGDVWIAVIGILDVFLFPKMSPPTSHSPEERTEDENIDCSIIEFLKCQVLARPSPFPHEFLLSIMVTF